MSDSPKSMFLSREDLVELTDASQRETQMRELTRLRIPFVNGRHRLKVLRAAVEAKLGVVSSSPESEPNWGAFE